LWLLDENLSQLAAKVSELLSLPRLCVYLELAAFLNAATLEIREFLRLEVDGIADNPFAPTTARRPVALPMREDK